MGILVRRVSGYVRRVSEPVRRVSEPVSRISEPVRRISEPVRRISVPVRRISEPIRRVSEPVRRIPFLPRFARTPLPQHWLHAKRFHGVGTLKRPEPGQQTSTFPAQKGRQNPRTLKVIEPLVHVKTGRNRKVDKGTVIVSKK